MAPQYFKIYETGVSFWISFLEVIFVIPDVNFNNSPSFSKFTDLNVKLFALELPTQLLCLCYNLAWNEILFHSKYFIIKRRNEVA